MKTLKRRFGIPKTLRSKVDKRPRTPQGALLELTRLSQEKQRLREELQRWEQRLAEIRKRVREIGEMEGWLYRFVEKPGAQAVPEGISPTADGIPPSPVQPDRREMTIRY